MFVIIPANKVQEAGQIMTKYQSRLVYQALKDGNDMYCVISQGPAAALIEIDMKFGLNYNEGKITSR